MQLPVVEKPRVLPRLLAYGVVFGWNAGFAVLACTVALPLLWANLTNDRPLAVANDFLLAVGASVLIAASSALLLRRTMRRSPWRLLSFFYGFQAPLMMAIFTRLFFIRELTAGSALIFASVALAAVSVGVAVFRPFEQRRFAAHAQYAASAVALVTALSLAAYIALYVPGIASFMWRALSVPRDFHIYTFVAFGLLVASCTLLLGAPLGLVITYVRHFALQHRYHRQRFGRTGVSVIAVLLLVTCWYLAGDQSHDETLARARVYVATPTKEEARALANDRVRRDLLDMYLARYRYLGVREGNHLHDATLQWVHNAIARPLLLDAPSVDAYQEEAAGLYEAIFDAPIQRAEREAVEHAFSSAYERLFAKAAASVVDIGAKRVRIAESTFEEAAGEITWHERYENLTTEPQEVLYHFALPEDAAITGLWLGESNDRAAAFTHQIAPRGAAQRVYAAEIRRRVDPALVEQVGPRQYRLRAYPIVTQMNLWMTFAAAPGTRPEILEQRNVFSDRTPRPEPAQAFPPVTVPGKVALVIDRSLSMQKHAASLAKELEYARVHMPHADVILARAGGRPTETRHLTDTLDTEGLGSSTLDVLLEGLGGYDAVFVITDDDTYDRATDFSLPPLPKQLFIVHLGSLARGYPDAVQEVLDGVGRTIAEASAVLQRAAPPEPALERTPAAQIAARRFIAAHARDLSQRARLHEIAKATSVVTPLSSMIVLIDDAQKQRLEQESQGNDAFKRDAENGHEPPSAKNAPFEVSATPEPEEWMLIAVLLSMLLLAKGATWHRNGSFS